MSGEKVTPGSAPDAGSAPVYEVSQLTKVYRMGEVEIAALRGVSFTVADGELLVLLGHSGSGKSTLLNILGGLDVPTAGSVFHRGSDLSGADERERTAFRRHHVGFVFQSYNLIPSLTARENVELVTEIADDPMDPAAALGLVGLGERLDHFPSQLSGGEQQRVAIPRRLQISHWYLESELASLRSIGAILPIVFLAVAAFLLHVVLGRIVAVQRGQIAILKAMGYDDRSVALHYLQWALAVTLVGALAGLGAGAWLGDGMTRMYTSFFAFPILRYRLAPEVALAALAVALVAAVGGALGAVRRVIALPPAEALRPEPPGLFRRGVLDRPRWRHLLTQPTRILLRNLRRHPGRAGLSVLGIAFGEALPIVGAFTLDSMDVMMRDTFQVAQRFDAMVTLAQPRSASALDEVAHWPGVLVAEPFRPVPVRLSAGHRSRQTALTGLPLDGELNRIVGGDHRVVELSPEGLVLSKALADLLGIGVGDRVTAEVLEGRRPVLTLPVARLVDDAMGTNAYLSAAALHRALGEGRTLSGASLRVDPARLDELHRRLKQIPAVAGEVIRRAAIESFDRTLAQFVGEMRTVMVGFAAIIAFGVVYNATRISLAERERELATLRVIGFRRAEIAHILLGEIAIVLLVAVPLGLVLGYALAALTVQAYQTEVYRLPLVVSPRTHAFAAVVTVVATALSSWIVRRRLQRLDLIGVLKTRE